MRRFAILVATLVTSICITLASVLSANAVTVTKLYGDNSKASFTGAIFHAYKNGKIYGKAYVVEPGGKAKGVPANTLTSKLAVYIPEYSCARVIKNHVKTKTFCNTSGKGKDVAVSGAAFTFVRLYHP